MNKAEKKFKSTIYKKDARKLNDILKEKIVDVTITSPPYYDLKDYGYKEQIGFGQEYEAYLNDLKVVFSNVYNCTKDNGTLWVIIDSFRRNSEVTPLPFDFSNKLKEIGWKLQDVIIWVKDRTVPWTHQGQMRNLFEYILVFSKSDKYNFFIDEVRDFESLKKWWVKYPERYNPKGKTPDGLWRFDIPTQGSWGNGYIKHFCPLPEEMIEQILKISTKENDVVLDPFAGSGAVLAKADNMVRNYVGFEMNQSYIDMFKEYLKGTSYEKRAEYLSQKNKLIPQNKFNELIIDLRALKYAKVILQKLPETQRKNIYKIYVEKSKEKLSKKNAIAQVNYVFFTSPTINDEKFIASLESLSSIVPLSKFGIQNNFEVESNINGFLQRIGDKKQLFTYTERITNKFKTQINSSQISNISPSEIILSRIKVDLTEKDYE